MRQPIKAYRLIPSKFPPIGPFDDVATHADARLNMELVGWTNDRLVEHSLKRLPESEWALGFPGATVIMAAFLHGSVEGARFNSADLGAWYASTELNTAIAEVAHHFRRDIHNAGMQNDERTFRAYSCNLQGDYIDIRAGKAPDSRVCDTTSWDVSQRFGEQIRAAGGDGIVYDSLRYQEGMNVVAFKPRNISEVRQTYHYRISLDLSSSRIDVQKLVAA